MLFRSQSLLSRCLGDPVFAAKTLTLFEQRALEDVNRLRKCATDGEAEGAQRLAHNLKAVASHVSAAKLREIAFELEQAGARRDLQFVMENLAKLENEARRCAAYIPGAMEQIASATPPENTIKLAR